MMDMRLKDLRVAILAENGYEDLELWYPMLRLQEEGAVVDVIGSGTSKVYKSKHGYPVRVDKDAQGVKASDYDALIVPGGWAPDQLRRHESVISLVKGVFSQEKVVGAICHAGSVLVSA
ncbi:MAG: DJ-1/PfpI family protein, partial [Nitrososphaerales archaeon]